MKFGYFDNERKEYVITNPATPSEWTNYLGSLEYGAIITNNAQGYSFVKSGASGRILRGRFNVPPTTAPGRYIYLRDMESGDFWSASWLPVKKDLSKYESICRHGILYTIISSKYNGIETETLYYVPLGELYEVWAIKVRNKSGRKRKIALFNFAELTNEPSENQDLVNMQYTLFIGRTYYKDNLIIQTINENYSEIGKKIEQEPGISGRRFNRFCGVVGADVVSYDGDRDIFIGNYRDYSNPVAVEKGTCSNTLNYGKNSCAAMQVVMELEPDEEKEVIYVLGDGAEATGRKVMERYKEKGRVQKEWEELKSYWHSKIEKFKVVTPDESFNTMVNIWNSYQCFMTFFWSRAASLLYVGLRDGYGFRDTVQDIPGIMHLEPEEAKNRLKLMFSGQTSEGVALPLVFFDHQIKPNQNLSLDNPEYVKRTGYTEYRCDDHLWLYITTRQYVRETGDLGFLDEVIPYSDKGEDTIYEHLRRGILFSLSKCGKHGLTYGLDADWNDTLRLGEEGESIFASFQLYLALKIFEEFAERKGKTDDKAWAENEAKKLYENIQKYAWEGDRFVRGFIGDEVIGSKTNKEASFWLNPQVWAILSGAATEEQAKIVMDNVEKILNTDYGAMIMQPPVKTWGFPVFRMILFLPGMKENAGIFCHPQGWLIRAKTILGDGDGAFKYYQEVNPVNMNDKAEIREAEPYVHCQFVEGKDSPFHGRAHVHWLTGTAASVQVAAVEGILGLQPDYDGLRIDPCIPSYWKKFYMERVFRGKKLKINVENPNGVQKGVKYININGKELSGNFIPVSEMKEENNIIVVMG
ncbi:MAG TPA: N,N'-diacetylchitobiose phosphorylase [Dictyoglomaceae bacterium]|nr:N,N'-diacetylchitobiose phosphorylase [Dictyoglomaceae bacterium]HOL39843.1 N,N'-diacetylchitobiose phosphorylase [Dictyoglomaceae bacterium]